MRRRYSENFDRDFRWFLLVRHHYNFDGKYPIDPPFDLRGVDARRAFQIYDSQGRLVPTRHPNIVQSLIRTKGSVNLHIREYAAGAHTGEIPHAEIRQWLSEVKSPYWVFNALNQQWRKMYITSQRGS